MFILQRNYLSNHTHIILPYNIPHLIANYCFLKVLIWSLVKIIKNKHNGRYVNWPTWSTNMVLSKRTRQ